MKKMMKLSVAGVMLLGLLTVGSVNEAQAGPFSNYEGCVIGCLSQYDNWTWSLSACSADCYIALLQDTAKSFVPFM